MTPALAGSDARLQPAATLATTLRGLRDRFDAAGLPVVYCNDNWTDWQGGLPELVQACMRAGGVPALLAGALAPADGHHHLLKPRHSAFMETALPSLLAQLRADRLVVAGIAADACVFATAADAHMRRYPTWVPRDCCASRTRALHDAALHLLRHGLGVDVRAAGGRRWTFPPRR